MIKKVFNWTFGAFFRTLGRIIAFLIVGGAIALIMAKLGLFDFMVVHAETFDTVNVDSFSGTSACFSSSYNADNCSTASRSIPFFYSYSVTSDDFSRLFYFNSNAKEYTVDSNSSYAIVPVYISSNRDFTFISNYSSSNELITSNYINFNLSIWNSTESGSKWYTCDLLTHDYNSNYYYYRCPVKSKIHAVRTSVKFIYADSKVVQAAPSITIGIGELWTLAIDNSSSIQNALDNTKTNTEDIKNSLNSDDVDDSSNTASGFFSDFSDNGHGLSGIVTAPLNAVNAMLTTTCTAPSATYKNKTFSLPCGDILWNQEGASNFKNILNLFYGGIICFGLLKSLFKDVNDLKNPDNDKVEVVDL